MPRLPSLALLAACLLPFTSPALSEVFVPLVAPSGASPSILSSFVSFAIEFSSFPSFAGNPNNPNTFSYQLLRNIGLIQGSNPVIRVGGNTADFALLNTSQSVPLVGITDPNHQSESLNTLSLGPSFFQSYATWPDSTFIHNLNLASNTSAGLTSLKACAALACKALAGGKLAYWELGNEPDFYKTAAQGPFRPSSWNEQDYVNEWLSKSQVVNDLVAQTCPIEAASSKFIGLSFAGTQNGLSPVTTWNDGIDSDNDIAMITGHFYLGSAEDPGITMQGSFLNHSLTASAISTQLNTWLPLASRAGLPFAFTEVNTFSDKGVPGLSNTFGAALWVLDVNLYCASQGVSRVHMQQGVNFNYGAWQPTSTPQMTIGTKAPYYGSVAAASFLGDLANHNVMVLELDVSASQHDTAYAAYVDGLLARIAFIQMTEYVYSTDSSKQRPTTKFSLQLPASMAGRRMSAQWLIASESAAITGVTFGGVSYNWELDEGRPVVLKNLTTIQSLVVGQGGGLNIEVPWSSAVILSFDS